MFVVLLIHMSPNLKTILLKQTHFKIKIKSSAEFSKYKATSMIFSLKSDTFKFHFFEEKCSKSSVYVLFLLSTSGFTCQLVLLDVCDKACEVAHSL